MPPRRPRSEMKYIYRQEQVGRRYVGWRVEYTRGLATPIRCFFSDKHYGGKRMALAEAKAFRDQVVAIHAPDVPKSQPISSRVLRFGDKPAELIGVRLALVPSKSKEGGPPSYHWYASARVDGRLVNRGWSVKKWGYEAAFWGAVKFRHSLTQQPLPKAVPSPSPELLAWAEQLPGNGVQLFCPTDFSPAVSLPRRKLDSRSAHR